MIFEEGELHNLVCIKHTPDSAAKMLVENGVVSWGDAPMVVNPWDEYAIEEALSIRDKFGGSVTVLTMGPESAKEALKTAIAMGCDHGILISDVSIASYDARITSIVISKAIATLDNVQIVFFGKQAIDGDTGLVPMSVAYALGWPGFSYVAELSEIDGVRVTTEDGWWLLRASNTENALTSRCESYSAEGLNRLKKQLCEQLSLSDILIPDDLINN